MCMLTRPAIRVRVLILPLIVSLSPDLPNACTLKFGSEIWPARKTKREMSKAISDSVLLLQLKGH